MPELPEVETIRRQLEPEIVGRRILSMQVLDERWAAGVPPRELEEACGGRRIEALERRGKYLLAWLEGGRCLVMHLRMTGNLLVGPHRMGGPRLYESATDLDHLRALFVLEGGVEVRFVDPRRFGHGVVLQASEVVDYFDSRLGVEPLSDEFTPDALAAIAAGRRAPLKSFLLAQDRIAGIGNIYADEALFRAGLHPLSPTGSMRAEHCERLREGVVAALERGLEKGGASIDDYVDARGEEGAMQGEFLVHRREGEPCPRCGETIRRVVVAGRSTYFCPSCQKRLRRRGRRKRTVVP